MCFKRRLEKPTLHTYLVVYKDIVITHDDKKKTITNKRTVVAKDRYEAIDSVRGEVIACKKVAIPTEVKKNGNRINNHR